MLGRIGEVGLAGACRLFGTASPSPGARPTRSSSAAGAVVTGVTSQAIGCSKTNLSARLKNFEISVTRHMAEKNADWHPL
jgi:hypothetical protein